VFTRMIRSLTATELSWIIRIILKDLKLGVSEKTILKSYHVDAVEYYYVCSDLKQLVETLNDPSKRYLTNALQIFQPFKPMLADREEFEKVIELMSNEEFYIETKLDGERIQLHKNGDEYKYWSRNGTDYTFLYGATKTDGSLTKKIHELFNDKVENAILDGEMVVMDENKGEILPFGTLKTAALNDSEDSVHPYFIIFDILLINGKCLIDDTLDERKRLIHKVVSEKKNWLEFVNFSKGKTLQDVSNALDLAV
ncbi:hypothetical protein ROZALSC1DRAFT_4706, partial [Rozella allomycis CSF55]